ncbi:MAG: hypothetical protein ACPGJV_13180 [Bacteriovoracaceae bacterium]
MLKKFFISKILKYTFIACVIFSVASSANAADPRVKAVMLTSAYGTIGGALLGTASLAFGTSGRAVAVGASVGLYVGLLFGGYVVLSHSMKNRGPSEPDDSLENDETYSEGGIFGSNLLDAQKKRFRFEFDNEQSIASEDLKLTSLRGVGPNDSGKSIGLQLLSIQF